MAAANSNSSKQQQQQQQHHSSRSMLHMLQYTGLRTYVLLVRSFVHAFKTVQYMDNRPEADTRLKISQYIQFYSYFISKINSRPCFDLYCTNCFMFSREANLFVPNPFCRPAPYTKYISILWQYLYSTS